MSGWGVLKRGGAESAEKCAVKAQRPQRLCVSVFLHYRSSLDDLELLFFRNV